MKNPDAYYRKLTKELFKYRRVMYSRYPMLIGKTLGYEKALLKARTEYRLFLNKKRISRRRK